MCVFFHTDWVALAWLAAGRVPRPLEGEGVAEEAGLAGLAVEAGGVVNAPGKGKLCFGAEITGTSMLLHHKKIYNISSSRSSNYNNSSSSYNGTGN